MVNCGQAMDDNSGPKWGCPNWVIVIVIQKHFLTLPLIGGLEHEFYFSI
jgi:hypothetical protein